MSHSDIILKEVDGVFVPSQPQVPVVKGDTIAISTSNGRQVALFFSPGAVPVFRRYVCANGPPPREDGGVYLHVVGPGYYSVFFEKDASTPPAHFPVRASNLLLLEIDTSHSGFGGPDSTTQS